MTFAFGHLIGAWIPGKIYEKLTKTKLHNYTWLFLLLGGILPDADFMLDWTLGLESHRTFTHSIFFLLIAPLIIYISIKYIFKNYHQHAKHFSLALATGILMHLILDMATSNGVPLFWPNLALISPYYIGPSNPATPSFLHNSYDSIQHSLKLAILDMGLGATWIFYLFYNKEIKP